MPENSTPKRAHHPRLDPRNPYVIDLRGQGRSPGTMREVRRSVPSPAGLVLDLVAVPDGSTLTLVLRLESVTQGVLVTGTVTAPIAGECGRCLDPVAGEIDAEFQELFAYPHSTTDETTDQDEVHRIEDDYIDLASVVRDAVVLGLPFTPLCQDDCAGLCPDCGRKLADLPPGHSHEQIDPKWAALRARFAGDEQADQMSQSTE